MERDSYGRYLFTHAPQLWFYAVKLMRTSDGGGWAAWAW